MKFVYSFLCIIIQQTGSNRHRCHCLEYDFHRFSCCDLENFCKGFIFRTKRLSLHRNRLVHSARKSIMYNIKLHHYLHILILLISCLSSHDRHHTIDKNSRTRCHLINIHKTDEQIDKHRQADPKKTTKDRHEN